MGILKELEASPSQEMGGGSLVHMYMYINIHKYVCAYVGVPCIVCVVYMCIYINMCIYALQYVFTCMCEAMHVVCLYVFVCVCALVNTHVWGVMCTQVLMCVCV